MNKNIISNSYNNVVNNGGKFVPFGLTVYSDEGWQKEGNNNVNGRLEGFGVLYYPNGNIRCKGNFVNGLLHGKATIYYHNGSIWYEGNLCEGAYYGKGTLYRYLHGNELVINNKIYSGQFVEGVAHGYGEYYFYNSNIKEYEGYVINGVRNGEGTLYYENGNIKYKGSFKDGYMHGEGTYYGNGEVYSGECFKFSSLNGEGTVANKDRNLKGTFKDGKLNGPGKVEFKAGGYYITNFIDGVPNGKSYSYDVKGRLIEAAELVNGLYEGNGIEYQYDESNTFYGCKKREYKAYKGIKEYSDAGYVYEDSIYWGLVFSPNDALLDGTLDAKQSYKLMLDVLNHKANREVDILCPWLSKKLLASDASFTKGFLPALLNALRRGVKVKIVTGMRGDRYDETMFVKKQIEDICSEYSDKLSIMDRHTHEKYLLCDDDFMLVGSHNQLSNIQEDGLENVSSWNKPTWDESMYIVKDTMRIINNRYKRFGIF